MSWDVIVIGSGFGGAMAAHELVRGGQRVLMLERGAWVARGPDSWSDRGAAFVTPHFSRESPFRVITGRRRYTSGAVHCIGGQSVFFGGASFRFRERDFEQDARIVTDSGAEWPFRYGDIEPYYTRAEQLLGVSGDERGDPTGPFRSAGFPQRPAPLATSSRAIADAARRLGMRPFRIPLAISYASRDEHSACIGCGTCDGYACAAGARNDIASRIIPELLRGGMTIRPNAVCVRLVRKGSRIAGVEYIDRMTRERVQVAARSVVLAAGTLATPHLLLASDLAEINPAADSVGRYLTRHCNEIVFGLFARQPNPERAFDKQIAIHDFYHGTTGDGVPEGPLGSIQQLTPPIGLARAFVHPLLRGPAGLVLSRAAGLLAIAEDQPRRENRIRLDRSVTDGFGVPRLEVRHDYTARDRAGVAALAAQARRVLREAGALITYTYPISSFSHALGTVRMGPDEGADPLDGDGRYRGLDNLYIADGSALPRSAGVNPSLTIAANALRIGERLACAGLPSRVHRPLPLHFGAC